MKPSWLPTDGFPCLSVQTSTADFARARRFKKVLKMLSSNRSKKAIQALKSRSRIILLCMILVHVIMFAVFRILDNGHNTIINQVRNRAALALPAFTSDWRIPATLAVGLNLHICVPAQVVQAASTLRLIQRLATEARALQVSGSYFNGSGNAQYFYPDQNTTAATMLTEVATVSNVHKSLYLGISKHAWSEQSCLQRTGAAAFCTADAHCSLGAKY